MILTRTSWEEPVISNRRQRGRTNEEELELFRDYDLPPPPSKERKYKSQRSTSSSVTSYSQEIFHEILQPQFILDREAKMKEIRYETRARVEFLKSQTRSGDLRTLAINTEGMDEIHKAIIEEAKNEIRA
ncbi:hypothetical protein Tco_0599046 [Tanacetum coccineum]